MGAQWKEIVNIKLQSFKILFCIWPQGRFHQINLKSSTKYWKKSGEHGTYLHLLAGVWLKLIRQIKIIPDYSISVLLEAALLNLWYNNSFPSFHRNMTAISLSAAKNIIAIKWPDDISPPPSTLSQWRNRLWCYFMLENYWTELHNWNHNIIDQVLWNSGTQFWTIWLRTMQ